MLRYRLIHPEILAALAAAGHGSQVLLADGHYPVSTGSAPGATRVSLNLAPDRLAVPEVLEVLLDAVVVEAAAVMRPPPAEPEPAIFTELIALLAGVEAERLDRFSFYEAARGPDVALVIATGERRTYANVLLTLGVAA
jgi:L-fucose mutarotase